MNLVHWPADQMTQHQEFLDVRPFGPLAISPSSLHIGQQVNSQRTLEDRLPPCQSSMLMPLARRGGRDIKKCREASAADGVVDKLQAEFFVKLQEGTAF
jgi:hypothetical protein